MSNQEEINETRNTDSIITLPKYYEKRKTRGQLLIPKKARKRFPWYTLYQGNLLEIRQLMKRKIPEVGRKQG